MLRRTGSPGNNGTQTTTGHAGDDRTCLSGWQLVGEDVREEQGSRSRLRPVLPQHSEFKMPNTLLGGLYGVETSVQETPTGTPAPCATSARRTSPILDIPASLGRELAVLAGEPVHVHGHAAG